MNSPVGAATQRQSDRTDQANRVAAGVVSRGVGAKEIAAQLSAGLDAVFLPRPLVLVERIPRDAVGKVSRARLLELTRGQPGVE